jgi:hypothetical protein
VPSTAINTFDLAPIGPWYPGPPAKQKPVRLPPSVSYPKGTVLGEVVGTNEAQTITLTTGGTLGGTYTLSYGGVTTGAIAFNATAATAALEGLSNVRIGNVAVTGTAGSIYVVNFRGALAGTNIAAVTIDNTAITGGGTYVVATTVGGAAGSGLHYAFDGTGADGRQVARAILPFAVTTDPSGNHFPGTSAVSPIAGTYRLNVPAWIQGSFRCGGAAVNGVLLQQAHLTSNPAWHLVEGNFADGVVTI